MHTNPENPAHTHTILIASGGSGTSGEQLVHTVLAQFPQSRVRVVTVPHLRSEDQLAQVVEQASVEGATLVHTLVDSRLRSFLVNLAARRAVIAIDLMGPLIERLESVLGEQSLGKPGLYRLLNKAYFDRVEAMEFSMTHDDGRHPEGWPQAEVVLVGASRVGKTPLSLYLSVLGWKVANIPIVPELEPPQGLYQLDPQRVIGLSIAPAQLLSFRQERQKRLGVTGSGDYTDPQRIFEELQAVERICKRAGISLLDVTDKPIETSAEEVIRLITGRFGTRQRPG
jgi:[pyruvate, water dikinase]-phosphate phosphotransferase / [pyruvate, water dikinase] kinase